MDTATLILGTYVITLVLTQSEGPYGKLYALRQNKKIDDFGVLNCFMCTAFWITLILCLFTGNWANFFIAWGGSVIIDKVAK